MAIPPRPIIPGPPATDPTTPGTPVPPGTTPGHRGSFWEVLMGLLNSNPLPQTGGPPALREWMNNFSERMASFQRGNRPPGSPPVPDAGFPLLERFGRNMELDPDRRTRGFGSRAAIAAPTRSAPAASSAGGLPPFLTGLRG